MNLQQATLETWTSEAAEFGDNIREELETRKCEAWTNLILAHAPKKEYLHFLDIGTGPGFFPIILTKAGHSVTGIDCTEEMLKQARKNAAEQQVSPHFLLADGQDLPFDDNSFDCVISRNVTWTLLDAEQAYREWLRVLRPGGRILIFDANWNRRYHDPELMRQFEEDQKRYAKLFQKEEMQVLSPEGEAYRRNVPMCKRQRPQWDFDTFLEIGVKRLYCDADITDLVWDEERKVRYRSTPMFLLVAEKPI
ncbi:MAG: class I SAM-dependent methyltransferase [Oscillospiraceae bacterium]|nr:class I SAM-dependent methyltransferase [Oscillospiraceae bacterium]